MQIYPITTKATLKLAETNDVTFKSVTLTGLTANRLVYTDADKKFASTVASYDAATDNITMGVDDIVFTGAAGAAVGGVSWANTAYGETAKINMDTAGLLTLTTSAALAFAPHSTGNTHLGTSSLRWGTTYIGQLVPTSINCTTGDLSIAASGGTVTFNDENIDTTGILTLGTATFTPSSKTIAMAGELGITGSAAAAGAGAAAVDVLTLTGGAGGSHSGGGNTGGVGSDVVITLGAGGVGTGGADGGDGGAFSLTTGAGGTGATVGTGGAITLLTGGSAATSGSGAISVKTGISAGGYPSGKITIETGTGGGGQNSGDIEIFTGTGGGTAVSGDIKIKPGDAGAGGTQGKIALGDGTNEIDISATGDMSFAGTAGFYPIRQSTAVGDEPTPDTGELMMWRDSTNNKVYLKYNDTDEGSKKIELV
jgi:hypothetical protein